MYKIIDGKKIASEMRLKIREDVNAYVMSSGKNITLAVVIAGDNPASQIYVRNKIKACEETGIKSLAYYLPEDVSQSALDSLLGELAENKNIDGILVQLPLPKHIDTAKSLKIIPEAKDVDGFSEINMGSLCMNKDCLVACTPNGVMKMLEYEGIEVNGKRAVVLGRSNIVGKPMAMLLLNADATVTVCHSKTHNLEEECRRADILVAAVGRAKFVKQEMVKEGAVVIDVGMNRDENGKLCGDVDFENVKDKCSYITPVPGGVGLMTRAMLMQNTGRAARLQSGL